MPPLPVIADVFRVSLHWTGVNGLSAENVMHFRASGGTASGLNTALQAAMSAAMWGPVASSAAIDSANILELDGSSGGQEFVWAADAKWTGQQATETMPGVAAVVKHVTGLRGRDRRGRTYVPLIAEGAQASGLLLAAIPIAMTTAWENFRVAMAAANFVPVVASYLNGFATTITQYFPESAVGTQRRRQGRVRKAAGL